VIAPLAHVGGVPVEEALLAFAPVAAVWMGAMRGKLHRRPSNGSALIETVSEARQQPPSQADGPAISYQALRRGTRNPPPSRLEERLDHSPHVRRLRRRMRDR
jgi:hypothetical protein